EVNCNYNALFPISGDIRMNGGSLVLLSDLAFQRVANVISMGNIIGNDHSVYFHNSISELNFPNLNLTGVNLRLVDDNLFNSAVRTIDWSPDNNYIAVGKTTAAGDDIAIAYFDGSTLTVTAGANISDTVYSVGWHPYESFIAVGRDANAGDDLKIFNWNVSNGTFTEVSGISSPTVNCLSVSWHPWGNFLASGWNSAADRVIVYPFNQTTGALNFAGRILAGTMPSANVSSGDGLDWDYTGSYVAAGTLNSAGAEVLIYYFDGSTLTLTANAEIGRAVNCVRWRTNDTKLAIGLSAGAESFRIYEHNRSNGSFTEIVASQIGEAQNISSMDWTTSGTKILIGLSNNANSEYRIYEFNNDNTLSLVVETNVAGNVNSVRWSNDDEYLSRGDSLFYLSVFKLETSLYFENVRLFFDTDVTFKTPITFSGKCGIHGAGHNLQLNSGFNLKDNSSLEIYNSSLKSIINNPVTAESQNSSIILNNVNLVPAQDINFNTGKIVITGNCDFIGEYNFHLDNNATLSINPTSFLHLNNGFSIEAGKSSYSAESPIYFSDNTSELIFDQGLIRSINYGLQFTKGKIVSKGVATFESTSTDTQTGIIFGDGTAANDVDLLIYPSAELALDGDVFTFDQTNENAISFLSKQGLVSFKNNSFAYLKKRVGLNNGSLEVTPDFVFSTTYGLQYPFIANNLSVDVVGAWSYVLTGTIVDPITEYLDTNNSYFLTNGDSYDNVYVVGASNYVGGFGNFYGSLELIDSNSNLVFSLNGEIGDIILNGGAITLNSDVTFLSIGGQYLTTGTVDIGYHSVNFSTADQVLTGTITWNGEGGILNLRKNENLYSTWNINGQTIVYGDAYDFNLHNAKINISDQAILKFKNINLMLDANSTFTINSNASLIFEDSTVFFNGYEPFYFIDDTSNIILKNSTLNLNTNLLIRDASILIQDNVNFSGNYEFTFDSNMSINIDGYSQCNLLNGVILSVGQTTSWEQSKILFNDRTSSLNFEQGTLSVTDSGLHLTKGTIKCQGSANFEASSTNTYYGLTFGDGVLGDDVLIQISPGASYSLDSGAFIYNQYNNLIFDFLSGSGILTGRSAANVYIKRQMLIQDGTVQFEPSFSMDAQEDNLYPMIIKNARTISPNYFDATATETVKSIGLYGAVSVLDQGDKLLINNGTVYANTLIARDSNTMSGNGDYYGVLALQDANSELSWGVKGFVQDITLNGGLFNLVSNLDFNPIGGQFLTTGTIDVDGHYVNFSILNNQTLSGNFYWDGTGGGLRLLNDMSFDGIWTFSGDVTLDGGGNTLDITAGKIYLVDGAQLKVKNINLILDTNSTFTINSNSRLTFDNSNITFNGENPFYAVNDSSNLILNNTAFDLNSDIVIQNGSILVEDVVNINGNHSIIFDSTDSITINSHSNLNLIDGVILSLGQTTSWQESKLLFKDSTSNLNFENGTLKVTDQGLHLTNGTIRCQGLASFDIASTSTLYGLTFGNGIIGDDVVIQIYPGATFALTSGAMIFNQYDRNIFEFLSDNGVLSIGYLTKLYFQRPMYLSAGTVKMPTAFFMSAPSENLYPAMFENVNVSQPGIFDVRVTETIRSVGFAGVNVTLDKNDSYLIENGFVSTNITVARDSNIIRGTGDLYGGLTLLDSNSTISWGLIGLAPNITLNGGLVDLVKDLTFNSSGAQFLTTGTINLNSYSVIFPSISDYVITSTTMFSGDSGKIVLKKDLVLTSTWNINGSVTIDGNGNYLHIDKGHINVLQDSNLEFKNIVIAGLKDRNISCADDSASITLKDCMVGLFDDFYFSKGSIFFGGDTIIGTPIPGANYTFYYDSAGTSTIFNGVTVEIHDGQRLSIGRKNGNSNIQPLEFMGDCSELFLNSSSLNITSSGLTLTKGLIVTNAQTHFTIENAKPDYGLIIGDGVDGNDFRIKVEGNGLNIDSGTLVYNNYDSTDKIYFKHPASVLNINTTKGLTLQRDLLLQDGQLGFNAFNSINLLNNSILHEDNMINNIASPYNVNRFTGQLTSQTNYNLYNTDYLVLSEGVLLANVNIKESSANISGGGSILLPINIQDSNATLSSAFLGNFSSNINLNGGDLYLNSNLSFYDDKFITGSGNIYLNKNSIWFGGTNDLHLSNTLDWYNASDINLRSKTILSGRWNFNGESELNGHGNILDLTTGGTLYLRSGATLNITDVMIKGLGINKGWIDFADDTGQVNLSNVTVELEDRFYTNKSGIYVDGPSTFILKNYDWTFDNNASLTVDGLTLWKDSTIYEGLAGKGDIKFGSGSIDNYLSLVSSGTIQYVLSAASVSGLPEQIKNNSNAIINLSTCCRYVSNSIVTHDKEISWNSSAILAGLKCCENNSNAIVSLNNLVGYVSSATVENNQQIINNSNAIINLSSGSELAKQNSNAIVTHDREISWNSSAIIAGLECCENNSNAIVSLANDVSHISSATIQNDSAISWNSSAILNIGKDISYISSATINNANNISYNSSAIISGLECCENNSNAIVSLNNLVGYVSSATVENNQQIINNSNAIINLSSGSELAKQNSNAIVTHDREISWNSSAIIAGLKCCENNSNAIV
ncbi:hypothetical protein KKE07_05040, partial [Candidatus Dependentiae bacterium]|nr:hypothetical protein [Candidatus Dependentiae bacterium]